MNDQLLTRAETAELLNLSVFTLARWAVNGTGPRFMRINSRVVRYRRSDVEAWVNAQECKQGA